MNTTVFAARVPGGRIRSVALIGALVGAALLSGCAAQSALPLPAPAPAPTIVPQIASAPSLAAPRPADASLKIVSPTPDQVLPAGPVKVSIDYSGPVLVPGVQAKKLDDYHLHFILDEDASQYIGTTRPIPAGNPNIIHSAAKEVTFDNVAPGQHTVTVLMSGNNHISVATPVTASVTFSVR